MKSCDTFTVPRRAQAAGRINLAKRWSSEGTLSTSRDVTAGHCRCPEGGIFDRLSQFCLPVHVRFAPKPHLTLKGDKQGGIEVGQRAVIQAPKPGDSNHALRTHRSRMGCHQTDAAEQAARRSKGKRPSRAQRHLFGLTVRSTTPSPAHASTSGPGRRRYCVVIASADQ